MKIHSTITIICFLSMATSFYAAEEDRDPHDKSKVPPIVVAASENNLAEVKRLIQEGADVTAYDLYWWDALTKAAINGNEEMVKELLAAGAHVDSNYEPGQMTPLMWAVIKNHENIVKILIDAGANINAYYGEKITPLKYASDNIHLTKLLLSLGADTSHLSKHDRVSLQLGLYFNISPRAAYQYLFNTILFILKFLTALVCFVILIKKRSLWTVFIVFVSTLLSTTLFIKIFPFVVAPFAIAKVSDTFIIFLLALIGFGFDMVIVRTILVYSKVIQKPVWPWVLSANVIMSLLLILFIQLF